MKTKIDNDLERLLLVDFAQDLEKKSYENVGPLMTYPVAH